MTLNNLFKIFVTIIFANYLDSRINIFMIDYYLSFSLGFLVFCFWVFSLPNNIYALTSFIIGLSIDLILGSPFELKDLFLSSPIIFIENLIFLKLLSSPSGKKESQSLSGRFIKYFCTSLSADKNKAPFHD